MSTTVTPAGRRAAAGRAGTVGTWALRLALAAVFAGAGAAKVSGDAAMVEMFADIGAGQWLRYLVGSLELAAAVGLLVPRLAGAAAVGLVGLMAGATFTNLVVLEASPALTIALLAGAAAVAWMRRGDLRASRGGRRTI
ncbi:DoxX family protein [Blastococcus xanthinilyticus]|uniref:DoxX-like protein n=1 Tax=Blastococcus xanthinilyticus TaxID=1564164 RepID=A0A5S5CW88_9ACTN|nr:DoxX family protein [Blastococcus xanthinilyticus]TYP88037.1 DoxX-like protein [Blastococcus xanthinilyticus]